ncbi:oligopeptide transporter 1 [Phtheirospermum japonicum]|uniref:Oligopeptide transporter 1 n=1 Tax=Phtheirospermum japonicum TaxID=374723 RepID=A0A830CBT9_9LAMI|nr:oligopeptide transporter 1 [Phtheirospermum japonicum]
MKEQKSASALPPLVTSSHALTSVSLLTSRRPSAGPLSYAGVPPLELVPALPFLVVSNHGRKVSHSIPFLLQVILIVSFSLEGMKITSCAGLAKPSILLVHYELPIFAFRRPKLISISPLSTSSNRNKGCGLVMKLHSSVSGRNRGAALSPSKEHKFNRERKEEVNPASFYTHPSLLQMKNDRIANRARVYEFLRNIGIVPDELDGLELPVTVDVMKERVEFLHKLGLKIEDINNYPLVLGCSVKKNMVPVLDYLGKLGVRKLTLTDFLRRYPQVLHASVVVDLAPVVKYLQGMDIKPNDIPRVLEQYPEVLGFKLEGTMSTSVAYLVGIGVARREIGVLGIPCLAVARLIEKRPHILGFGLDEKVKPNVELLLEYNVKRTSIASVIAQYPEIIGIDLERKLESQRGFLGSVIELGFEDFGKIIERMPQIVSLSDKAIVEACGFSKGIFDYFKSAMGRPLDDLVNFPAYFTYGLESMVKPRHKMILRKGVNCSLSWLLNCSDEKFEDRMSYDLMDIEEMEVESSFDMSSLMKPNNEESDSEAPFNSYPTCHRALCQRTVIASLTEARSKFLMEKLQDLMYEIGNIDEEDCTMNRLSRSQSQDEMFICDPEPVRTKGKCLRTAWWLLTTVENICDPSKLPEGSPWTCPGDDVFYNASIIWGVVGPLRMFGNLGLYPEMNYFFLIGLLAPLPVWYISRRYPEKKWIKFINVPILISGAGSMPVAKAVNYMCWFSVGMFFNLYVYKRYRGWWARHNYILSAALDAGVAFMATLCYFTLQFNGIGGARWWGLAVDDHCPLAKCPMARGIRVEGCPVFY